MIWYVVIGIVIYLIIGYILGRMMENVAAEKGYGVDAHAFSMCFWLGIIGCIYVAALPDKILQNQNQQIIDLIKGKGDNND